MRSQRLPQQEFEPFTRAAWRAVVAAVESRIENGAFGLAFPDECRDRQGIIGTSEHSMGRAVLAAVPDLSRPQSSPSPPSEGDETPGWPLRVVRMPPPFVIVDLIEFCFHEVAEPFVVGYHDLLDHCHLAFDKAVGQTRWVTEVNKLLARNDLACRMTDDGRVTPSR